MAGRADTDLDTVIRICPFRVFGNFSTLLNYRVSCLHSSSAAAASVAAATPVVVADVADVVVVVGRQAHFLSRTLFDFTTDNSSSRSNTSISYQWDTVASRPNRRRIEGGRSRGCALLTFWRIVSGLGQGWLRLQRL